MLVEAELLLNESLKYELELGENPTYKDSCENFLSEIIYTRNVLDNAGYRNILENMNDDYYQMFEENYKDGKYVNDNTLNALIFNEVYNHRDERSSLRETKNKKELKEQKKLKKAEELAKRKKDKRIRENSYTGPSSTNSKYDLSWKSNGATFTSIGRTLANNNIRGCGEFYYRNSIQDKGEYLVGCSGDGINWKYYIVWILLDEVMGPYGDPLLIDF